MAPIVKIEELKEGLAIRNVNYKILRIGTPYGKEKTPLSALTEKLRSALRIAYELGFYEIPRKARIDNLARKLRIDKGTFNDHLRRAEKHALAYISLIILNRTQWTGWYFIKVLREHCRKICICFRLNIRLTQVAL